MFIAITYLARLIMYVLSFVALAKAFKVYKVSYPINSFIWILILSVFDNLLYLIVVVIMRDIPLFYKIVPHTQGLYQLVEYCVILKFCGNIIKSKYYSIIIKIIILIASVLFVFFQWYSVNFFDKYYLILTILEIIIVNVSASKILIGEINSTNLNYPTSIIILIRGLFIFINFTAPYHIISSYLGNNLNNLTNMLNIINDLGYIIFFISLYKSYKCYRIN